MHRALNLGLRQGVTVVLAGLLLVPTLSHGDWLRALGLRKRAKDAPVTLSEEQITSGLKAALARGVESAVSQLGRTNGFLQDTAVRIPLPEGLQRAERILRSAGQGAVADELITTLNRAAEAAVPEAAQVLGDAIRQLTLADVQTLLTSTNTAATDYFRRTSESQLQERFLPIVKSATARSGVASTYQQVLNQSGLGASGPTTGLGGVLARFGRSALGADNLDLDQYVTERALDGLFVKIADEERRIRENPAARTTELLEMVFGSLDR